MLALVISPAGLDPVTLRLVPVMSQYWSEKERKGKESLMIINPYKIGTHAHVTGLLDISRRSSWSSDEYWSYDRNES